MPEGKLGTHVKLLVLVILLSTLFRSVGLSIVEIGLPDFILDLGGDLISYGLVFGVFSITQAVFQFPFAAASDKYGRKPTILIGMTIYITGTFLCFFAQDIPQLIIFRAIQGAGAYTSILMAIMGDIYQKNVRGKGMGYYSLSMNIGYFGGIVIGGYIAVYLGFRSVFLITGFLIALSAFLIFLVYKEKAVTRLIEVNIDDQDERKEKGLKFSTIKVLLKERQYDYTVFVLSIRWFIFGGITAYLIWVLQEYFLLDEIEASYVMIFIIALYALFILVGSRLTDKVGPKKMILIGQIIVITFGVFFFIEILVTNLIIFILISSIIGIGLAIYEPSGSTLLLNKIDNIDSRLSGSGIGFNNAIGFLSSAIGSVVITGLGKIYVFFPFYVILGFIAITFIIVWKLITP